LSIRGAGNDRSHTCFSSGSGASLALPEEIALPQRAAAFRGAMIGGLAGRAAIRAFFEGCLE